GMDSGEGPEGGEEAVMTTRQAIRKYCLWLHKGNRRSVHQCSVTGKDYRVDKPLQQARAIRANCLDYAGSPSQVRNCQFFDCPLWEFRSGRVEKRSTGASFKTNNIGEGLYTTQKQKHAKTTCFGRGMQ
ncbi:MAG TPA: hypothetical protein PLC40_14375, partial [Candidatus Hydrogenedentes bacterium]|nr:hypothetical protein [Candidatus Hydrogenedentota bacterium]